MTRVVPLPALYHVPVDDRYTAGKIPAFVKFTMPQEEAHV